ncbi:MAG: peptidase E [Acidobacteria bacterium]|nr:peptidase E [Acidobacteriota bacterium]
MGGGGFSMEPDNLALDFYTLQQARKVTPSVCFVATASGDAATYVDRFYSAFTQLDCQPTHLALFDRTPDLRPFLLTQDVIYVGGGNTKSMLAVWREWDMPEILREAWDEGIILAGISAGAICWFEAGLTDSWGGRMVPITCLGMLSGACSPHYDGEAERRPALHELVTSRALPPTLALEDGVAAHFVGAGLFRLVSSRPNARAYRVHLEHDKLVETALPAELLPTQGRDGRI